MPDYRLYLYGRDGHINRRVELTCETEAEAVAAAEDLNAGHTMELWDGGRFLRVWNALSTDPAE
jgi:hypothetical protein